MSRFSIFGKISTKIKDHSKSKDDDSSSYTCRQGLPNLVNTCYINSIVQFLYSSSKLLLFLQREIDEKRCPLTYHLNEVFNQILGDQDAENKKKTLKKLIEVFQNLNREIKVHSQQDLFEILLLFLNALFQENPDLQKYFQIVSEHQCPCRKSCQQSFYLQNTPQKCFECGEQLKVRLLKQNQLLIVKTKNKSNQQVHLYKQFNEQFYYKCIAKVFYRGNRFSGHYTASRLWDDCQPFIEFSDMEAYDEISQHPIFLLYEKCELGRTNQRKKQTAAEKSKIKQLPTEKVQDKKQSSQFEVLGQQKWQEWQKWQETDEKIEHLQPKNFSSIVKIKQQHI